MSIFGGILGGLGGLFGASQADKASKRAAAGQAAALEEQRRQFDRAMGLLRPGVDRGNVAGDQLMSLLGLGGDPSSALEQIQQTPGYGFQLDQGTRALNSNRSAGGSTGGALLQDFAKFNQGTASNFYSDYANRLAGIANTGQQAAGQGAHNAIVAGQGFANSQAGIGASRAAGALGVGNSIGNAITDIGGYIGSLPPRPTGGVGGQTTIPDPNVRTFPMGTKSAGGTSIPGVFG